MNRNNLTSLTVALLCALVVFLELSASSKRVQARYLPTRADETDVEVLKSLIRNLMLDSQNDLFARNLDRMEARQRINGHPDRQCNFQQQQQQSPVQLQKRALELPVPDNSQGDSTIRVPMKIV